MVDHTDKTCLAWKTIAENRHELMALWEYHPADHLGEYREWQSASALIISNKVTVNLDMFGTLMENMFVINKDSNLIVTKISL